MVFGLHIRALLAVLLVGLLGYTHLTATDFSKLKTVNTLAEAQTASLYTKMSTALNYEDEVVRVCKAIEQRNSYTAVEKQYLNSLLDKEKKLANAEGKNLLVQVIDDALDHVSGAGKFTLQQIEDYVALATKQGNQSKVMLGKTDAGGVTGYVSRAGNDHAYFKMTDSEWDEALTSVGNDLDEMWKVNKKFIDNRKALGNEFYLSHNPATADGFYLREINYLTKSIGEGGLGGSVVDLGNNLWKIVW